MSHGLPLEGKSIEKRSSWKNGRNFQFSGDFPLKISKSKPFWLGRRALEGFLSNIYCPHKASKAAFPVAAGIFSSAQPKIRTLHLKRKKNKFRSHCLASTARAFKFTFREDISGLNGNEKGLLLCPLCHFLLLALSLSLSLHLWTRNRQTPFTSVFLVLPQNGVVWYCGRKGTRIVAKIGWNNSS